MAGTMRVILVVEKVQFVQTHPVENDGYMWAHVGGMELPLSRHIDEDGGTYSYYYMQGEYRINHATTAEWADLPIFIR